MTRAEQRELRRKLRNEIAEFLKIQNHYFPELLQDMIHYQYKKIKQPSQSKILN